MSYLWVHIRSCANRGKRIELAVTQPVMFALPCSEFDSDRDGSVENTLQNARWLTWTLTTSIHVFNGPVNYILGFYSTLQCSNV